MARQVHLIATIGLSGQIGIGGTVPWVGDEKIMDIVSRGTGAIMQQCRAGAWVAGPSTVATLVELKRRMSVPAQICYFDPALDPATYMSGLSAQLPPDMDIWIMGGCYTFSALTPFVDVHHITVVPYDGTADKYLEPIVPGWRIEGETICRKALSS